MSHRHTNASRWVWLALPLLTWPAQAQAQPNSFEERRQLMRQVTQQLQARLEQRLRCVNQAKTWSDLDQCQRTTSTGWHHGPGMGGPGMGGWGCPIW
ncbi:MAG: hypothetical protein EBZ29_07565 [Synechococcaceae bacterium WB9_4xC_028]|jgi:hypothetical protein|nr:hypothetical protein [Synechococcaceae bacterium WB9_4xC_028]